MKTKSEAKLTNRCIEPSNFTPLRVILTGQDLMGTNRSFRFCFGNCLDFGLAWVFFPSFKQVAAVMMRTIKFGRWFSMYQLKYD